VRLGNPEQVVRLLPSTQGYNTIAVLPGGCNTTTDYTGCVTARAGIFNPAGSKTWQDVGKYGAGMQNNLGYEDVNAEFGLDGVGLGIIDDTNVTFASQVIGAIEANDFYVGTFGLGTQPTNFTTFSQPHTSFFTSLWENRRIPSYTWYVWRSLSKSAKNRIFRKETTLKTCDSQIATLACLENVCFLGQYLNT
jgi:hypothetical protein